MFPALSPHFLSFPYTMWPQVRHHWSAFPPHFLSFIYTMCAQVRHHWSAFPLTFSHFLTQCVPRSGTTGQSEGSEVVNKGQTAVLCLTKYSKGFLCSAGNGIVYMYEKTDERELYKKAREIRIPVSADTAQSTANLKVAFRDMTIFWC